MATNQITAQARGIVVILQGKAWLTDAQGNRRPLKVGDEVQEGQQVVTEDGTRLELALPNGQPLTIASGRELLIDGTLLGSVGTDKSEASLTDLNRGSAEVAKIIASGGDLSTALESTALGLSGGGDGDSHSFVRVLRIDEGVSPLSIERTSQPVEQPADLTPTPPPAVAVESPTPETPVAPAPTPAQDPTPEPTPTPTPAPTPAPTPTPVPPLVAKSVPLAVNDNTSITEDAAPNTVAGSVLTNDTVGTDANATPVTAASPTLTYGSLVLNSNGSYTYTLDNANPAVNALKDGQSLTDSYTYTLTDGDGDTTTAVLTITINGHTDGTPTIVPVDGNGAAAGQATVNEVGLLTVANTSEATSGTITVTAPDGLASIVVGGTTVTAASLSTLGTTPVAIDTGEGTLTLTGFNSTTGALAYRYTLKGGVNQPGVTETTDTIALTVNDLGGGTNAGTLTVRIVDSTPTAVADTGAITEDANPNTVTGSVFTNDTVGADTNATPVTAASVSLTYGSLVLNSNGSYIYTLNNGLPAVNALKDGQSLTETYTYTLKDGDGDTSTATLTITINGHTDGPPTIVPVDGNAAATGQATVNEIGLLTVGNTTETTTGTITVSAPDGLASVVVGGTTFTAANLGNAAFLAANPVDTGEGTLTITGFNAATGALSYTYTLKAALNQPAATESTDSIALTVNDLGGASSNGTLTVQIVDSNVTAIADSRTVTEDQVGITGNVVTGVNATADVMGADTPITVTGVQAGNTAADITSGVGGSGVAGTYGTFTVQADGSYTYVTNSAAQALNVGDSRNDVFSYTIKDADGDYSTTTVTMTVTGSNDLPTISAGQTSTVSEEGLANGIADTSGTPSDNTDATVRTGQFTVSDPDNAVTVTLGAPAVSLTSSGNAVTWALTNANQTLTGSAAGQTVMTVTIDNTGAYTTTLLKPIDHPNGGGENLQAIPVTVTVTGGSASSTSTLTISVEDDAPSATQTTASVTLPNVNTNILLTLDVSGSMTTTDGGGGKTRLQLMKESVNGLLDGYDNLGDVRVRIVTFSTTAGEQGTSWVDVATAKSIVNGLSANGSTNYDAGIATAQGAFSDAGKLVGAQNVAYFLSDGQPNPATSQIDPGAEATWTSFLNTNDVKSFSFGMGTGATQAALDPIAYDGLNNTNTSGIVVSDITQLPPILRDSVVAPTAGNVIGGGLGASVGFGADGGFLQTLSIDGSTYTYDPKANSGGGGITVTGTNRGVFDTTGNTLAITTLKGGKFVVDLDTGDYTYTAAPTITVVQQEDISYTVLDADGDSASSTLKIDVNPPVAVAAVPAQVATISSPTVLESTASTSTSLVYTVNLDIMTGSATTYTYNLGDTGAAGRASAADHGTVAFSNGVTLSGTTLTVPAGVISFTVTIPTLNAGGVEGPETLPLTIGGVTGTGTIAETGTFTPSISIDNVSVNESQGNATFTVTLSHASANTVTVNYSTSNGTATTAGNDYVASSGTVTFLPGQTTRTVAVNIREDATVEGNETFNVNLTGAVNATIADNQGVATIVDNEAKISINDVTVDEAAGTATFTVSLSDSATSNVTVQYSTSNGTATAGSDYTARALTTLTFAPGETTKTVTVNIANDTTGEPNETFNVNLSNASTNATIVDAVGVATIVDNEPRISINDVTVNEGAGTATFTVSLSQTASGNVTVQYATANGTATAGSDYTAAALTTLTFAPGETSKTITVPIVNGPAVEGNETFSVNLSNPSSNAIILDGTGTATIIDNAPAAAPLVAPMMMAASTSTASSTPTTGFSDLSEVLKINEDTKLTGSVLTGTTSTSGAVSVVNFQIEGNSTVFKAGETATLAGIGTLVIGADGNFTFIPSANYNGSVPVVTYSMTDGSNNDSSTLSISVTAVNDTPIAVQDIAATQANAPVTLTSSSLLINDSDADGNPLTLFSVQDANHGSVAMVGSDVVFTPTTGYTGAASFTYTVSDGQGGTSTTTVDVNVNGAPVANSDAISGTANNPITIAPSTLLANDSDPNGDPLTINSVLDATHGTVALVDGNVVFTPTKDYVGDASFSYTISDGHGGTASGSVSITIAADLLKAGSNPV